MQKFKQCNCISSRVSAELTHMAVVTKRHISIWPFVYIKTKNFRSFWRPLWIDYLTAGYLQFLRNNCYTKPETFRSPSLIDLWWVWLAKN